jgi:hypothetical protein
MRFTLPPMEMWGVYHPSYGPSMMNSDHVKWIIGFAAHGQEWPSPASRASVARINRYK